MLEVGRPATVSWDAGHDVVGQRVLLSTDGGASFREVSPELGAHVRSYILIPTSAMVTSRGRIRVVARDGAGLCSIDDSARDFSIAQAAPSWAAVKVLGRGRASFGPIRRVGIPLPDAPPRSQASVMLWACPGSAMLTAGQRASFTVTIDRTSFAGAVDLLIAGLPRGVSASFGPESASGSSSVLTIRTAAGARIGSALLTIGASAPGILVAPITIGLTVCAPSAADLPTITGFFPASGRPGTHVLISGRNLAAADLVQFGGAPASFVVVSPELVRATVPAGAPTGRIRLLAAGASAVSAASFVALSGDRPA